MQMKTSVVLRKNPLPQRESLAHWEVLMTIMPMVNGKNQVTL